MSRSTESTSSPICQFIDALGDHLVVAVLWTLVLLCYWKIALAGRVLAGGDAFSYFYPYWAEATRALRAGRLPLWNPHLFMGVPFLANSQVGFFYPLNWPLWLLFPPHRSVHLTIVLHLCLAALNAFLWGRKSLRLGRVGAGAMGAVFALGGYLGAQVEHVNQLQGLAWLPLMLMLYDRSASVQVCKCASLQVCKSALAGLSAVVGLVVLAGHTQTAFISLVGLAIYGLGSRLWLGIRHRRWRPAARSAIILIAAAGLGFTLAAVQLIPTWRLSRLSVRAQGLPFNERVSFSLSPLYAARALLPGFTGSVPPEHIEHVAYVGITGLALAAVGLYANTRRRHSASSTDPPTYRHTNLSIYLLLAFGLFFALGLYNPLYLLLARYVPGFAHFRVPARWLALYVVGASALVGRGVQALWRRQVRPDRKFLLLLIAALIGLAAWAVIGSRLEGEGGRVAWSTVIGWAGGIALASALFLLAPRAPRTATLALVALLMVELFAASATLPHARATAPQAFTSLRPAIAHLLASSPGKRVRGRFLSMSDITFDPGDLSAIRTIYGPQLSDDALYDYIVSAKKKEVLSPNLPLAFGVPAVDGYDGGVLPLARYVTLQRLFLPSDRVSIDGRLRENLSAIPSARWLNLFNVQHVITDKLQDAWIDDVFYDLQFGAQLSQGEEVAVAHLPRFEATALGVVSSLRDGAALVDGSPVGVVEVEFDDGTRRKFTLRAGEHTAQGAYGPDAEHAQATVGRERSGGNDYVARLRWSEPAVPVAIAVRATLPAGDLLVRGVSLIDERTGGFQSLVLSDQGRFRLAHSGDVKIYENLDVLPRAFIVHETEAVGDDAAALAAMRKPTFDPASEVVLALENGASTIPPGGTNSVGSEDSVHQERALIKSYRPERVEIEAHLSHPGYLVLSDAWYPAWEASVDGEPAPVHRADVLFRAIALDAGCHKVTLSFRSRSLRVGAAISLISLLGLLAGAASERLFTQRSES